MRKREGEEVYNGGREVKKLIDKQERERERKKGELFYHINDKRQRDMRRKR